MREKEQKESLTSLMTERKTRIFRSGRKGIFLLIFLLILQSQSVRAESAGCDVQLFFYGQPQMEVTVYDGPVGKGNSREAERGRLTLNRRGLDESTAARRRRTDIPRKFSPLY